MNKWQKFLCLFGRVLISLLFILSAINKVVEWSETEQGLTTLFCDWQTYSSFSVSLQNFFGHLLEWVPAILIVLTVMELLGGLLVFFGVKIRLGAVFLLFFMVVTTFLFHHFWFLSGLKKEMQFVLFLKNLAIIGGLLYIVVLGAKKKKPKEKINEKPLTPPPSIGAGPGAPPKES